MITELPLSSSRKSNSNNVDSLYLFYHNSLYSLFTTEITITLNVVTHFLNFCDSVSPVSRLLSCIWELIAVLSGRRASLHHSHPNGACYNWGYSWSCSILQCCQSFHAQTQCLAIYIKYFRYFKGMGRYIKGVVSTCFVCERSRFGPRHCMIFKHQARNSHLALLHVTNKTLKV